MHRIADGDTLGQLAAHYLGGADCCELYDFNRDVLSNPELLPIGAELRIPTAPFRPAESGEGPGARGKGDTIPAAAQQVSQSLDGTVKAPVSSSGPAAAAESPPEPKVRLKLQKLPPFPANGPAPSHAPRTYIVQRGDTLNSIAERLYGDDAKETILLEANRNLVAGTPDMSAPGWCWSFQSIPQKQAPR